MSTQPQSAKDILDATVKTLDDTIVYWSRLYEDANCNFGIDYLKIRLQCAERITQLRECRSKLVCTPPIIWADEPPPATRGEHFRLKPYQQCGAKVTLPDGTVIHCQRERWKQHLLHEWRDQAGVPYRWPTGSPEVSRGDWAEGIEETRIFLSPKEDDSTEPENPDDE